MIITGHINIETARKDTDLNGNPLEDGMVSEWAMAITLARYKIGEEVEQEELERQLEFARTQQILDKMIEDGLIDQVWSEEKQDFAYKLTEKGVKMAKDIIHE